jgi:hypothetical protein
MSTAESHQATIVAERWTGTDAPEPSGQDTVSSPVDP